MRKFIRYGTLAAALLAGSVTTSFAQGTTGSSNSATTGASGPAGIPSPATGTSSNSNANTGSMSQSYSGAPMTNPGTLPSGIRSGGTQSSVPAASSGRLNGTPAGSGTNTPSAAAGRPCGLSLADPTSGSLTPLTQPLSPGSAAGGCE